MKINSKSKFSLIKVICICLILILLSGVGVMAVTTRVNTVKIKLSNGCEMTVLTSKTNVRQILLDNNIILEDNENVVPSLDDEISQNKTIVISDKSKQEIEVAKISETGIEITLDSILEAYSTIIEKIEIKEETIPFETVTKDISNGSAKTKNQVLQEGVEGLKKVTYKVKYQNDIEIERTCISEEIIQEPVNKIIQVKSNIVASRSAESTRNSNNQSGEQSGSSSSSVKICKVTAYCSCSKCCGSYSNGYTASGTKATAGRTIAASSSYAYGTKLNINGKTYVVEDRGGAISGNRIDIYVNSHSEALAWGVKYLPVEVEN